MKPPDLQFQDDVFARMEADPFFDSLAVTMEADGQSEADIAQALGPMRAGGKPGGQAGSLVIVTQTEDGRDDRADIPGPQEQFELTVRVLELPKIARRQPGYVSYNRIAQRIKQLFHQVQIGSAPILYVSASAFNDGNGTIGKDVKLSWRPSPVVVPRVMNPTMTIDESGHPVFACNTAGAAIFATFDGSYPAPIPANATPTNRAPLAGEVIRFAAYLDGRDASGVSERQF